MRKAWSPGRRFRRWRVATGSRSHLAQRIRASGKPRGPYRKAGDEELSPLIRRLVDERPSTGHRRIAALLNRELARQGHPIANRKRVYRIMSRDRLLLEQAGGRRSGRLQDGEVMVEASDIRWRSDALEFACWNAEVVRMAFVIDAFDREIIAFTAIAGAGISGSDIRDLMLEAVERRFGAAKAPKPVEHLSDNGSPYAAKETRNSLQRLSGELRNCPPLSVERRRDGCPRVLRSFPFRTSLFRGRDAFTR